MAWIGSLDDWDRWREDEMGMPDEDSLLDVDPDEADDNDDQDRRHAAGAYDD